MRPEDIRRLYRQEAAATEAEARATQDQVRADPESARKLLATLAALAGEDRAFAEALNAIIRSAMLDLIQERMAADDAYALRIGALIVAVHEALTRPPPKTPRGKNARTA